MDYFKSLKESDLIDLVKTTKSDLYVCLPSIHGELADAIITRFQSNKDENKINLHLLIDFDTNTFRQGYGNADAVQKLIDEGIDVKSFKDNRISFVISDSIGYYLFIESRSLIPAEKETINAIRIDPISLLRLKKYFFSSAIDIDFEDELTNAIIEESAHLKDAEKLIIQQTAEVTDISLEKLEKVVEDLTKNPPLDPDYKRAVEFYSNKFQYVKLKFEGANLQTRKVVLPKKALPITDTVLKNQLETKLNLFDKNQIDETFAPLQELKQLVTDVREKYLKKVKSREESLIDRKNKQQFLDEIILTKKVIEKTKTNTVINLSKQITKSRDRLITNLTDFLKVNPKSLFNNVPNLLENDADYVSDLAESKAKEIVYKIKWPDAHDLVEEFKLVEQYSDITFEDLKNPQFINELFEINLIDTADVNNLAEFSRVFKSK